MGQVSRRRAGVSSFRPLNMRASSAARGGALPPLAAGAGGRAAGRAHSRLIGDRCLPQAAAPQGPRAVPGRCRWSSGSQAGGRLVRRTAAGAVVPRGGCRFPVPPALHLCGQPDQAGVQVGVLRGAGTWRVGRAAAARPAAVCKCVGPSVIMCTHAPRCRFSAAVARMHHVAVAGKRWTPTTCGMWRSGMRRQTCPPSFSSTWSRQRWGCLANSP